MSRPFLPEDLALFNDLGQLDVARRRDVAACVVRSADLGNDTYRSRIWLFPGDGSEPRPFTTGDASDTSPRWSPDESSLAFVSSRSGTPQVHLLRADGGEARQLTSLPEGVGSIEWNPDGKRLLAACAVSLDVESREARRPGKPPAAGAPELAWRLPYKSDGIGFLLQRAFVLFVVDAATGKARQVTPPRFDILSASWSPDGQRIAYARTREGRHAQGTDVWIMDADGGNARQVSFDLATVMSPRWSPDGRLLAFCGARDEGDAQTRLFLAEAAGGAVRQLGDDDLEVAVPESLRWSGDGSAVMYILAHRARQHVVSVSLHDGNLRRHVQGDRHIAEFGVSDTGFWFFSEAADSPRELYRCARDGSGERAVSALNAWWWERTPLEATIRSFQVPDGEGGTEAIDAWVLHAKGGHGPRPMLVEAHGGPNAFALLGYPWNTYWNTLCSKGWAIVVPHAVGSTGFGRRFASRLNGRWGELDFPQFMAVVDALQREGLADERLVIAGKSYGGFMAAWAIGHTDRFRAAIVAAPVANLESHYGTSDGGYYSQPYVLDAERHIDPDRYRALSPVNYAHRCVTPTLLLQGKEDERCPRGQSEELFAVLSGCDTAPAEMVMYPNGGHHFFETGTPSHRLDVVRRMMGWIERWVPAA